MFKSRKCARGRICCTRGYLFFCSTIHLISSTYRIEAQSVCWTNLRVNERFANHLVVVTAQWFRKGCRLSSKIVSFIWGYFEILLEFENVRVYNIADVTEFLRIPRNLVLISVYSFFKFDAGKPILRSFVAQAGVQIAFVTGTRTHLIIHCGMNLYNIDA